MSFDQDADPCYSKKNAGHDMSNDRVDEKRGYDSIDTFSMTGLSVDTNSIDMESTTGMSFSTANTDIKFVSKVKNDSQYNDEGIHNNSFMPGKKCDLNAFSSANIDSNHVDSKLRGFQPSLSNNSLFIEEIVPQKDFDLFTTSLVMEGNPPQGIFSEDSSSADDSLNLDQKGNTLKLEGSSQLMSICSKVTDQSESIVSVSEKKEYAYDGNKHSSANIDSNHVDSKLRGFQTSFSNNSLFIEEIVPQKDFDLFTTSLVMEGNPPQGIFSEDSSSADDSLNLDQKGNTLKLEGSSQLMSICSKVTDQSESIVSVSEKKEYAYDGNKHDNDKAMRFGSDLADGKSIPNQVTGLERQASQISTLTEGKSVTAGLRSSTTSGNQMMSASSGKNRRCSKSSQRASAFNSIDDDLLPIRERSLEEVPQLTDGKSIPNQVTGLERKTSQISSLTEGKSVTAGLRSSTTSGNQMISTSSGRTRRSSKSSRSSSSFINIDDLSSVNENMSDTDSGILIENKFEKWKQEIIEWQDEAEREDSQVKLIEEELQAYKEIDNMNEMASMMSDTRFY